MSTAQTILQIMKIINEYESTDKSALIEDLLVMLGDVQCAEILNKLKNELPLI